MTREAGEVEESVLGILQGMESTSPRDVVVSVLIWYALFKGKLGQLQAYVRNFI